MDIDELRRTALSTGCNTDDGYVQAVATIYVGDQLGRIADVLEQAPAVLEGVGGTFADMLHGLGNVADSVAPEGEDGRAVRVEAGLRYADVMVEPGAITEARQRLGALAIDVQRGVTRAGIVSTLLEIERLLG